MTALRRSSSAPRGFGRQTAQQQQNQSNGGKQNTAPKSESPSRSPRSPEFSSSPLLLDPPRDFSLLSPYHPIIYGDRPRWEGLGGGDFWLACAPRRRGFSSIEDFSVKVLSVPVGH